jgi:tungstate transport system permease protein
MSVILDGFEKALTLIVTLDGEVYGVVFRSLRLSLSATAIAALMGVPLGFLLGSRSFRGRRPLEMAVNTSMAMPTVVVGLILYLLLSRKGPLGWMSLLFTPGAIVLGEVVLSLPLVIAFTASAVRSVDPRVRLTAMTLGGSGWRTSLAVLNEVRFSVLAAVIAGFGRAVSEVGSALMLGGNIRGHTRTMTTAIALEVSKGELGFGLALGFFLLSAAFTVNILFHFLQVSRS